METISQITLFDILFWYTIGICVGWLLSTWFLFEHWERGNNITYRDISIYFGSILFWWIAIPLMINVLFSEISSKVFIRGKGKK